MHKNYFIFYCPSDKAYKYLGNTSYVGIWADSRLDALETCKKYIGEHEPIIPIDKAPDCAKVGYIY